MQKRNKWKHCRRLISAFSALILLLGVSLPASAAESKSYSFQNYPDSDIAFSDLGLNASFTTSNESGNIKLVRGVPLTSGSSLFGFQFFTNYYSNRPVNPLQSLKTNYTYDLQVHFRCWVDSFGLSADMPSKIELQLYCDKGSKVSTYPLSFVSSPGTPVDVSGRIRFPPGVSTVDSFVIAIALDEAPKKINLFTLSCYPFTLFSSSPNDDLVSYFEKPVSPPSNKGEVDGTLSDYQKKEDELNSSIDTDGVASAISGLNLSGIIASANVFGDCFDYLWGKLGKLQVVSQFAIVSGVVMMILGLGATAGNVMEYRRAEQVRAQERAARQASQDLDRQQWRAYLVSRHERLDAEHSARFSSKESGSKPSYDMEAFKKLGYDLPDLPDD